MTNAFIKETFETIGYGVKSVQKIRNKATNCAEAYCFVHFFSEEDANRALSELNGTAIQRTDPIVLFHLGKATAKACKQITPKLTKVAPGDHTFLKEMAAIFKNETEAASSHAAIDIPLKRKIFAATSDSDSE